jgi:hypothetical protein
MVLALQGLDASSMGCVISLDPQIWRLISTADYLLPKLILFGIPDAVKGLCLQICSVLCVYNSHAMVLEHRTTQQFLLSRITKNTILHARKITGISQLDQDWMDLSWNTIKMLNQNTRNDESGRIGG